MDAMVAYLEFGGAEIKGSERRGAKLAWAVGPEKEVSSLFPWPQALPRPRRRLAPIAAPAHRDPRVLPVDLMPQLAALYLEAGPAGWAMPVCQLLRDRAPPPGRWGAAKDVCRALKINSTGPELFHRGPGEGLNFWTPGIPAVGNGEALLHPSHFTCSIGRFLFFLLFPKFI